MNSICLSKDVCRKCFEIHGTEWNSTDDALWEPKPLGESGIVTSGNVFCSNIKGIRYGMVDVGMGAPDDCKYKTEHLILGESFDDYMDREPVPYPK